MKNILAVCLCAVMFSTAADAMVGQSINKECLRRCMEADMAPEKKIVLDQKLAELREKKSRETDPQALKLLSEEEEELKADHEDHVEKVCKYVCDYSL